MSETSQQDGGKPKGTVPGLTKCPCNHDANVTTGWGMACDQHDQTTTTSKMSHDHKKQQNRVNSLFLTNLVSAIITTSQFVIRKGVDWTPLSERHGQSPPDCGYNKT